MGYTKKEEERIAKWIDGDIYLRNGLMHGLDSKDTDYDDMATKRRPFIPQDSAYLPESPMDPYELYNTQSLLDNATDCSTSIGGIEGKNFDPKGTWRRDCKIFYPVI